MATKLGKTTEVVRSKMKHDKLFLAKNAFEWHHTFMAETRTLKERGETLRFVTQPRQYLNVGPWTEDEIEIFDTILATRNPQENDSAISRRIAEQLPNRIADHVRGRIKRAKQTVGEKRKVTERDDEAMQKFIEDKTANNEFWSFAELALQLKMRTGIARQRYNKIYNDHISTAPVCAEEMEQIQKNFKEHGTLFSKYDMPHRTANFLLYALMRNLFLEENVFEQIHAAFVKLDRTSVPVSELLTELTKDCPKKWRLYHHAF